MSHLKERKEKDCLNCGTLVQGRFCQSCGQENVEVKESFMHLIIHFVEDLTHFDGKLWKTAKLLLFKPAALTQYYMDGKRASYIHPIRMYLFISAVFFLIIFNGEVPEKPIPIDTKSAAVPPKDIASGLNDGLQLNLGADTIQYHSVEAYKIAQAKLPASQKDKWFKRNIQQKVIDLNIKYNNDKFKIGKALIEKFEHYFSRMLYISLPLFALFLWILYRRNKNHYFVDHLIFSIHIYCAFFTFLFFVKIINLLTEQIIHKSFGVISAVTPFILLYYLYKALRNHFAQSRSKTILKFLILNFLTMIMMFILMLLFILLSLFNI